MSSASLREFDRQLRRGIASELTGLEFSFARGRTFRRLVEVDGVRSTQIIEFQVGDSSLSGRFTVNLAVYNPDFLPADWSAVEGEPRPVDCLRDLTQRLGFLYTPRRTMVDRLLGRVPQPSDHWWVHGDRPAVMRRELDLVRTLLLTQGTEWLNSRASAIVLSWAKRQLERRKVWNASRGQQGTQRGFEPEPFPLPTLKAE